MRVLVLTALTLCAGVLVTGARSNPLGNKQMNPSPSDALRVTARKRQRVRHDFVKANRASVAWASARECPSTVRGVTTDLTWYSRAVR